MLVAMGVLLALPCLPAQDIPAELNPLDTLEKRTLGSQTFQLDLGLFVPLFNYTTVEPIEIITDTNLEIGGSGHVRWSAFFNDVLAIGFDIGGNVTTGPNDKVFGNLLIGPRLSAVFRAGMFQIPLAITPAFSLLSYGSQTYAGFALRPEVGFYVDLDKDWALGLNVGYTWTPEDYVDNSTIPASEERVGNALELTLSIMYSF